MRIKKQLKIFTAALAMALSFAVVTFAANEAEVTDGSIYLCDDSQIYINETFSGAELPSSGTDLEWKYHTNSSLRYLTDGGAFRAVSGGWGQVKLKSGALSYSSAEGTVNKYMLSFDMTRTNSTIGFEYPFKIVYGNGSAVNDMASGFTNSDSTYDIRVSFDTTGGQNKTIASGIAMGAWCKVNIVYTMRAETMSCDITVLDSEGNTLGTLTDYSMNPSYNSSGVGISGFQFASRNSGVEFQFDNIEFYAYKNAEVSDPTITEAEIPGIPEMIEGSEYIIDENFDEFPESITENSYIGADGTNWSFSGTAVSAESKILSSGRRVMKLSTGGGFLASAAPENALEYSGENENNKYVLLFGMKLLPETLSSTQGLLKIKNKNGDEYTILNITEDGILKAADGKSDLLLEEKWYSMAVIYDMKSSGTNVKCVFTDGETVTSFSPLILSEVNDISRFIFSAPDSSFVYLDNLILYNAVTLPSKKPEARDLYVNGVCCKGRTLTGGYTYWEANLEEQGDTECYWVRSDKSENGTYTKIDGTEQSFTYTLQSDDIGKYVFFAVLPKKADGYDEPVGEVTYKCADGIIEEEPAKVDLDALIDTKLGVNNLSAVKEDLILLKKGAKGSKIEWTTDNSSVISTDGTVKRQSNDEAVTLTAKVTSPDGEVTLTHEFNITVIKKEAFSGGSGGGSGGKKSTSVSVSAGFYSEDTNKPIPRPVYKYNDVSENHWAMDYIQELYYREIAQGTEDNNFEPDRSVTREEFTKMIVSAFELTDSDAVVEFEDVNPEEWYYRYIASAYKNLIIDGIGGNKFGTGAYITRQDIAVIAYKTFLTKGLEFNINGETIDFEDADEISDYAKKAAEAMRQAGIMNGSGNNKFRPADFATRAEVAKIIVALLNCSGE